MNSAILVSAARPHPFRPRRYLAAALLGTVVAILAAASSLVSTFMSGQPGHVFLFGLPALALMATGTVVTVQALAAAAPRRQPALIRGGVLLGLGFLFWLLVSESAWAFRLTSPGTVLLYAAACLPTTGFALWVIRHLDRNEKEPWRLMLVAVAWGAVVASTLALWGNQLWFLLIDLNLPPGPASSQSLGFSAGLVEEISKGTAVVLLYLVMRNEFDDVVDGIVYGAAVGIGFNYLETVLYMSKAHLVLQGQNLPQGVAEVAPFVQLLLRQGLGLFTGHATFTALVGAGIGIARQMPHLYQRALAIICGFLSAIAAHMVFDAWIAGAQVLGNPLLALLAAGATEIVGNGAFTAVVILLLVMGLQAEANALGEHLRAESANGRGAVLPEELPLLLSPLRRFRERVDVLLQRGFRAWLDVMRLRNAQLDLGMERWHRARQELDKPLEAEEALRQRVIALREAVHRSAVPGRQTPATWPRP